MTDTQKQIVQVCDSIQKLLLDKNRKYGDSAINPLRIFSKVNTIEQLCVRIDDKLSRISRGVGLLAGDEDVVNDLIGYLVLLKIAQSSQKNEQWDGADIDTPSRNQFWNTLDASPRKNFADLNDSEWLDMYASGDKFA